MGLPGMIRVPIMGTAAARRPSLSSTSRPTVSRYLPWPVRGLGQDEPRTHLQFAYTDNTGSIALTEMTGCSRCGGTWIAETLYCCSGYWHCSC